jgi:hypothetical protein
VLLLLLLLLLLRQPEVVVLLARWRVVGAHGALNRRESKIAILEGAAQRRRPLSPLFARLTGQRKMLF